MKNRLSRKGRNGKVEGEMEMMAKSFAYYRMPYADHYVRVEQSDGEPLQMDSLGSLDGQSGFVMAPFVRAADAPLLLIRPDVVERRRVTGDGSRMKGDGCWTADDGRERMAYAADFDRFYNELHAGRLQKIVLARHSDVTMDSPVDAQRLFLQACKAYPRMFVALVSTPLSGTWLMATPEMLLQVEGNVGRTMALAGTMALDGGEWSAKNIEEQRLVAAYIADRLAPLATDIKEEGPRTVRAGHLVHLRSDFCFTLREGVAVGSLLDTLHPTPAVCGIPKEAAFHFILHNETVPRRYYSGFCGPLNLKIDGEEGKDGASREVADDAGSVSSLFVSLRCMQIRGATCRLYAGGGLLKDSREQQEWEETEAKMQTMRALLLG